MGVKRPIITPLGEFESMSAAGRAHGMGRAGVWHHVMSATPGWTFADGHQPDGAQHALRRKYRPASVRKPNPLISQRLREWHTTHTSHLKGRFGASSPCARAVVTPLGWFGSVVDAANAHQLPYTTVHHRVARGIMGWHFADQPTGDTDGHTAEAAPAAPAGA